MIASNDADWWRMDVPEAIPLPVCELRLLGIARKSICFSEVQPRVSLFEGKNCQFSAHEKLSELILTEFKQVGTSVCIYIKYTKNLKRFDVYIYKSTNNDYSLIPV